LSQFHTTWGYVAVGACGVVGLWGVLMARRESPPKAFYYGVGVCIVALLAQILVGVLVASSGIDPGNQHVFYGVVIAVTLSFAYIYRAQFRKRPALYYGLLLLFTMGLGIRGILTFGGNF
jgi:heme A synthase